MCAKKVPANQADNGGPAESSQTHAGLDQETAVRVRRKKMTWREWFLYDFLRHWYGLGAIALVVFFALQVSWMYHVKDAAGLSLLGVCCLFLLFLEFYVYKKIWPQGVLTTGWPAGRHLRRAVRRLRWRL